MYCAVDPIPKNEASVIFFWLGPMTETITLPLLNWFASIDWIICDVGDPEAAIKDATPTLKLLPDCLQLILMA